LFRYRHSAIYNTLCDRGKVGKILTANQTLNDSEMVLFDYDQPLTLEVVNFFEVRGLYPIPPLDFRKMIGLVMWKEWREEEEAKKQREMACMDLPPVFDNIPEMLHKAWLEAQEQER